MFLNTVLLVYPLISLVRAIPTVQLGDTLVSGAISSLSPRVETFKGLPYAEPPLGQLRFQQPVLKTSLPNATFNATDFGPACLQKPGRVPNISEDCLSLNVYRPSDIERQHLPVLVFIHGGSFTSGSSSIYDGSILVDKSIARATPLIVVTINYRLLQLGFPQGEEAGRLNALNLGLHDQLASLKWVQANILAFGGDPDKVTLAGESAGAYSVDAHLHGEGFENLARAAIMESTYGNAIFSAEDGDQPWAAYVSAIPECASLANSSGTFSCLQEVDTTSLVNALSAGSRFQPVMDGVGGLIPDWPSQITVLANVPTLLGTNLDEGTLFSANVSSSDVVRALVIAQSTPSPRGPEALDAAANVVMELYPDDPALGSPFGTGNETFGLAKEFKQLAAITGDFIFQSHSRQLARDLSAAGKPTFLYHFTDPDARLPAALFPDAPPEDALGVTHATELFYLGLFGPLSLYNTSPTALALSDQMQEYWISFITCLDPNDGKGTARPLWPAHEVGDPQLIQLDGTNLTAASANFRAEGIEFFNEDPILWRR